MMISIIFILIRNRNRRARLTQQSAQQPQMIPVTAIITTNGPANLGYQPNSNQLYYYPQQPVLTSLPPTATNPPHYEVYEAKNVQEPMR